MEIYVLDGLNGIIGMIENYQSCIWTVQSMDLGNFELILQATPANIDLLKSERLLVRSEDINGSRFDNVMVIEAVKVEFESDIGWRMTVSGRGLKSIIGRRIVWYQTATASNMTVEAFIRAVVDENCITVDQYHTERIIDDLRWTTSHGLTEEAALQVNGENVAEWITHICVLYGYSWDMYIDDYEGEPCFWIDLWKGTDRAKSQATNPPVVFSEEYDNLLAVTYTVDRTRYRNCGEVVGEYEGVARLLRFDYKNGVTSSGLNAYEIYVDGTGISEEDAGTPENYNKMLRNYGREQLWEYTIEKTFEGQIEPQGTYILGTDYSLGDKVTLETSLGLSADVIITEIIDSSSEEGRTVILNLQEWEVNS